MTGSVVVLWAIAFLVTNLDDLVLLGLFFAHPGFRTKHVIIGEYAGIGTILLCSVVGAIGTTFVSTEVIGLLGLVPIVLGARYLLGKDRIVPRNVPYAEGDVRGESRSKRNSAGRIPKSVSVVWMVTVANGADNFSLYVPLFRERGLHELWLVSIVFAFLTGMWCVLAISIQRNPLLGRQLRRHSSRILPIVLIALGAYILYRNGTITLAIWLIETRLAEFRVA